MKNKRRNNDTGKAMYGISGIDSERFYTRAGDFITGAIIPAEGGASDQFAVIG